jgi:hypothetical protein
MTAACCAGAAAYADENDVLHACTAVLQQQLLVHSTILYMVLSPLYPYLIRDFHAFNFLPGSVARYIVKPNEM